MSSWAALVSASSLLLLMSMTLSECGKVLVLHPMHATSHVLSLRTLTRHLAAKGHQITTVRWLESHNFPPLEEDNMSEHVLAINNSKGEIPLLTQEERARFLLPQDVLWSRGTHVSGIPPNVFSTISAFCEELFQQKHLIKKFEEEKFDVAIVDMVYNECSLMLAHYLDVPSVGFWAFTFSGGEPQYTQAFSPPSIVPLILSHCTIPIGFLYRVHNYAAALISHLIMQVQFAVTSYQYRLHLDPAGPNPGTLLANLSGVLINSHPALDVPRLLPPAFVNIAGFHIREPKPLPYELESWLEKSGSFGTILLSLGSSFDAATVPEELTQAFLKAFGRLKQNVIMKFNGHLENVPRNVKVVNWLPQQDILGHKQTVLFITHCGMHGIVEALHYAVPMVGMPIFADQEDNLVRLVERGVAAGIEKTSTSDQIYEAIYAVLSNQRYKEEAIRLSSIIRSSPTTPLDEATWLIEHIMETKGAHHLKVPGAHLNVFQYWGVDVLVFVIVMCYLAFKAVGVIFKRIYRLYYAFCNPKKKVKTN